MCIFICRLLTICGLVGDERYRRNTQQKGTDAKLEAETEMKNGKGTTLRDQKHQRLK